MRSSDKRHAKPTSAQLIDRIYRKQIAFEAAMFAEHDIQTAQYRHVKDMLETLMSGQRMLSERMESFRVLADHCARLLREKETLMKMRPSLHTDYERLIKRLPEQSHSLRPMTEPNVKNPLTQANDFMSHANNDAMNNCSFAGTHQRGIICGVCGARP